MKISDRQALMILNAIPHIGPITAKRLISHFRGDAKRIFFATAAQLSAIPHLEWQAVDTIINHRRYFDVEREELTLSSLRGEFWPMEHDRFPELLKNIPDSPIGVYKIGDIDRTAQNIAIVGSRTNTLYGLEVARKFAMELSRLGFCIVSGMARGIDSAAHEGALAVNGRTIAVLGCGADVIYPSENASLYSKIATHGAIISEFPLGRRADKQTFPIRNRLIAGLCHAVIVVESNTSGGSMITARLANEYGRHVFAVPGRIDQSSSAGCLSLIKEGATMLTCIDDIFNDLPYLKCEQQQGSLFPSGVSDDATEWSNTTISLEKIACPMEKKIYQLLLHQNSADIDTLVIQSELPVNKAMFSLQMLEIRGLIKKRYDGRFEVV